MPVGCPLLLPPYPWRKPPTIVCFSRLYHTAFVPAVYASQTPSPGSMQDSLPVGCRPFPGGVLRDGPPFGPTRSFQKVSPISSFYELRDARAPAFTFFSFYSAFFAPQMRRKAALLAAKNRAFRGSAKATCGCHAPATGLRPVSASHPYNPLRGRQSFAQCHPEFLKLRIVVPQIPPP